MNGSCYCCNESISYQSGGFHCGHKKSLYEGGTNELDNLEIVCSTCNIDMGTMNMELYKKMFEKK